MKTVFSFILYSLILSSLSVQASVEVLFHPHDPTLEKIANWLSEAQSRADIAMYNIDTLEKSPVIQVLKSPEVKSRIVSGELKIRMIFEGYGTSEENQQKMRELEALGLDVRYLGKAVKVHHKFAVIDADGQKDRVITGSANWSLSSYRNYNENIVFFENESEATERFQFEFERLWKASKEFGNSLNFGGTYRASVQSQKDLEVFFNSPRRLEPNSSEPSNLTEQVVRLIDSAQEEIQVATTRIRLIPVLDAVLRAAERNVKVKIVISQDDYADLNSRAKWLFTNENIELRIKFYNLRPSQYMVFQMHNKFMIVDHSTILTGSFNWSPSSENNHIENLVELRGAIASEVIQNYEREFQSIWEMNRTQLPSLVHGFTDAVSSGRLPTCGFTPTVFQHEEIAQILTDFPHCSTK